MHKTAGFSPNTAQKVRVRSRVWELSARVLTWHSKNAARLPFTTKAGARFNLQHQGKTK